MDDGDAPRREVERVAAEARALIDALQADVHRTFDRAETATYFPGQDRSLNGRDAAAPARLPAAIISASTLATKQFTDPTWAVDGVLPEGLSLIIGKPKQGKSWLMLGLGIAIASGGYALGKIQVEQGDVLLLCLEDNERRLQERLWRVLDGEAAPERLHLVTEWPRLDEGGDERLHNWLVAHPAARLVGIDVLERLRPPSPRNGNLYQVDYATAARIKAIADQYGVPVGAVHHSRKATADDPLDTISGTNGLAGAADTALILTRERGRADANLYVRGRDVPEADYALSFDPVTCQWSLLGNAADFRLTAGRAEVVKLLHDRGPLGPKEIAETLGVNRGTMRVLLHRMANKGELRVREGVYACVTGVTPRENCTTTPKKVLHPRSERVTALLHPVTPLIQGCNRENGVVMPNSGPVTPVTSGAETPPSGPTPAPLNCGTPDRCQNGGGCTFAKQHGYCLMGGMVDHPEGA